MSFNATRIRSSLDSARSSEDLILQGVLRLLFHIFRLLIPRCTGPAEAVLERDTTDNSVPSTRVPEPTISILDRLPNSPRLLPNAHQISKPTVIQPAVSCLSSATSAADGGDCVISLLSPSCGTTSGGERIVLIVVNLPPSIPFFARFGDNVVSTVRFECPESSRPS